MRKMLRNASMIGRVFFTCVKIRLVRNLAGSHSCKFRQKNRYKKNKCTSASHCATPASSLGNESHHRLIKLVNSSYHSPPPPSSFPSADFPTSSSDFFFFIAFVFFILLFSVSFRLVAIPFVDFTDFTTFLVFLFC